MSITGNPERDALLKDAILKLRTEKGFEPSLRMVQSALPPDFDLDGKELGDMRAAMKRGATGAMAAVEAPDTMSEQIEPAPVATAPVEPIALGADHDPHPVATDQDADLTHAEAAAALRDWERRLHAARQSIGELTHARSIARAELVKATHFFLTGNTAYSREQLQRDHIASEQARKNELAAQRGQVPPGMPSAYDLGRAGHGSNANRRYYPVRRGLDGQRAYSLRDAQRLSGSAKIATDGRALTPILPPVASE